MLLKSAIFFAEALYSMSDTLIGDIRWKPVFKAFHFSKAVFFPKMEWCPSASNPCMILLLLAIVVLCFFPSLKSVETNVLGLS